MVTSSHQRLLPNLLSNQAMGWILAAYFFFIASVLLLKSEGYEDMKLR